MVNVFRISIDRLGNDDLGSLEVIVVWYRRRDNRLVMEKFKCFFDFIGIKNIRDGIKFSIYGGIMNKIVWYKVWWWKCRVKMICLKL